MSYLAESSATDIDGDCGKHGQGDQEAEEHCQDPDPNALANMEQVVLRSPHFLDSGSLSATGRVLVLIRSKEFLFVLRSISFFISNSLALQMTLIGIKLREHLVNDMIFVLLDHWLTWKKSVRLSTRKATKAEQRKMTAMRKS